MPTLSPNRGIKLYNVTDDVHAKHMTFRTDINGENEQSGMMILDKWSGEVDKQLEELKSNKPIITIEAIKISQGYFEATHDDVIAYDEGIIIAFIPNRDCDGTTTLNINSLGVKSLMKYGADGSLVNLNEKDLRIDHEYMFRYDGVRWIWQSATSGDQINVTGESGNLLTVSEDNTVVDSGIAITDVTIPIGTSSEIINRSKYNFVVTEENVETAFDTSSVAIHNNSTTSHTDMRESIDANSDKIETLTQDKADKDTTTSLQEQLTTLDENKADVTITNDLSDKIDVLSESKVDKNNAAFTGTMTLNGNEVTTTEQTGENVYVKEFDVARVPSMENKTVKLTFSGNFVGKIKVMVSSTWSNVNASGYIEKEFNYVYFSNQIRQNSSRYLNNDSWTYNEYSIGEINRVGNNNEILIKSSSPTSNNYCFIRVEFEGYILSSMVSAKTLTCSEFYSDPTPNNDNRIALATTEKTEIFFPFAQDYMDSENDNYKFRIIKQNSLKTVRLYINCRRIDSQPFTLGNTNIIGFLPAGYLPITYTTGTVYDITNRQELGIRVYSDGQVNIIGDGVSTNVAGVIEFDTV